MTKRDDTVGRMAGGKRLVACSETDIEWIQVWVVTPEGCLLVWENEEENVEEVVKEMCREGV